MIATEDIACCPYLLHATASIDLSVLLDFRASGLFISAFWLFILLNVNDRE